MSFASFIRSPQSNKYTLSPCSLSQDARLRSAQRSKIEDPLIKDGIKAIKTFSEEGIKTNCTLCFSATQALIAAKAGATYISPFLGRLDDISTNGMTLIEDIVQIYLNYGYPTEVLAASIRHPMHVLECAKAGADVATMPLNVITGLLKHPLTDSGLERFLKDWHNLQKSLNS